jgi:2-dehydropantoate 2-reductase
MRIVVIGAGGVGGTIGASLVETGNQVTLVARGAHGAAIAEHGLRFTTPETTTVVHADVVESVNDLTGITGDDIIVIAAKSQDTHRIVTDLARVAPQRTALVCAQNGLENERTASRFFPRVYGMWVTVAGTHLRPGEVAVHSSPLRGALPVGRFPTGIDDTVTSLCALLGKAHFLSRPIQDIQPLKRAKFLINLGNAIFASIGPGPDADRIREQAVTEALSCFQAAGLAVVPAEQARAGAIEVTDSMRETYVGSSTFQSLARQTGAVETDYLNGEVVLLGRLHHIPTPVNWALQQVARRMADGRSAPGSLPVAVLDRAIELATQDGEPADALGVGGASHQSQRRDKS